MFKSKSIMVIFLAIIFLFVSIVPAAAMEYTLKRGYLVAMTKDLLKHGMEIYLSGDTAAFNHLLKTNPYIFVSGGGTKVYLEETTWTMYVRIRPAGQTMSVWTIMEAIK